MLQAHVPQANQVAAMSLSNAKIGKKKVWVLSNLNADAEYISESVSKSGRRGALACNWHSAASGYRGS